MKQYQHLSDEISIAADTGNGERLRQLDAEIYDSLQDGSINLPQAGELTLELEMGMDALGIDEASNAGTLIENMQAEQRLGLS